MGFHHRAVAGLFEGTALAVMCEEGNPRLIVTTLGLPFRKEEG